MKFGLMASMVLLLSACGSDSGNGAAAPAGPVPGAEVSTKLKLKSAGVKKVLIGATRDMRSYVENFDNTIFQVVGGQSSVEWADPHQPLLRFKEGGEIAVLATDTKDKTAVVIQFRVVFDSTGLVDEVPVSPGEPVPVSPGPIF
jgi:hypothetical protein